MARRLIRIIFLLTLLNGCSEDSHKPSGRELGLQDLRLHMQLSATRITHGDTLSIEVTAYNPYSTPVEVRFGGYSCWEWFWVYDEEGEIVSPYQLCRDLLPHEPLDIFRMDSLEKRHFTHKWLACDVSPGLCTVVAGFNAPLDGLPHTTGPVTVEILATDEEVAGSWSGSFFGIWRGSIWGNQHFALTLAQKAHVVSGTLSVGESTLQIENGLIQDNQIRFSVSHEAKGFRAEFVGDVCPGRVRGPCRVFDAVSGELLEDIYWHIWPEE